MVWSHLSPVQHWHSLAHQYSILDLCLKPNHIYIFLCLRSHITSDEIWKTPNPICHPPFVLEVKISMRLRSIMSPGSFIQAVFFFFDQVLECNGFTSASITFNIKVAHFYSAIYCVKLILTMRWFQGSAAVFLQSILEVSIEVKILGVFPVAQQWRTEEKKEVNCKNQHSLTLSSLQPKRANVTWVIKSVPHLLLCHLKNTNTGVKSCFMWCAYISAHPYTVLYAIMVSKCKNTKKQWKKRRYWTWAAYSYWRTCWKSFEIYTYWTCIQ